MDQREREAQKLWRENLGRYELGENWMGSEWGAKIDRKTWREGIKIILFCPSFFSVLCLNFSLFTMFSILWLWWYPSFGTPLSPFGSDSVERVLILSRYTDRKVSPLFFLSVFGISIFLALHLHLEFYSSYSFIHSHNVPRHEFSIEPVCLIFPPLSLNLSIKR